MGRTSFDSIGSSSKQKQLPTAQQLATASRYRWKSNWEFMLIVLMATMSPASHIFRFGNLHIGQDIHWLQFAICVIFLVLPVQYMQTAVGQYTQLSGTYLKCMTPIAHGLGYAFVLLTLIRILPDGILAGDSLLYILNCLQSDLPWLICKQSYGPCWNGRECLNETSCLSKNVSLSTSLYWNITFMKKIPWDYDSGIPDFRRLVTAAIIWIIVYISLINTQTIVKKGTKYAFITACIFHMIIVVYFLMSQESARYGLNAIVAVKYKPLTMPFDWANRMVDVICLYHIGSASSILFGSYLAPKASSGILTVVNVFMRLLLAVLPLTLHNISSAAIAEKAKIGIATREVLLHNHYEDMKFTIPIAIFGYFEEDVKMLLLAVPQLWTIMYFLMLILYSISHILIVVRIVEVSLEDVHSNLTKYRKYMLFGFLVVCLLISIIFVNNGFYMYTRIYFDYGADIFEFLLTLLFIIVMCWIYGVQRLCDDIHFIMGVQPTKFWKFTWYISPIAACVTLIIFLTKTYCLDMTCVNRHQYMFISNCLLFSPVIILGLQEIFIFIKKRNLVGLFQPTEKWGPPDPDERVLRQIFNPRKEIRSRRRNETCQHKCLLNSRVLKRIVTEEMKFHMKIPTDFELLDLDKQPTASADDYKSIQKFR